MLLPGGGGEALKAKVLNRVAIAAKAAGESMRGGLTPLSLGAGQHSHSRTAVRNSRREVDMNVHVVLYLRACTYRYRCLISKICVLLTQIFLDMCIAVCLPGQLVNRYSFCVSDDLFYMLFLQ